jgi:hypothetical protein
VTDSDKCNKLPQYGFTSGCKISTIKVVKVTSWSLNLLKKVRAFVTGMYFRLVKYLRVLMGAYP